MATTTLSDVPPEVVRQAQDLDIEVEKLKITPPEQLDFLDLVRVKEGLMRNINLLRGIQEYQGFVSERYSKIREFTTMARALVPQYFLAQEKMLAMKAEHAIEKKDAQTFRTTIFDLSSLVKGSGKVAYDYRWITADEISWHIFKVVEDLEKRYVEKTGDHNQLQLWKDAATYHEIMDWK
jgi:hypothetical protein